MKNYEALEQFQNVQLTELWKGSPQLVPPILPITRGISEDRQPFTDTVLGSTACPNLQLYFTSVRLTVCKNQNFRRSSQVKRLAAAIAAR
jgi:hypothetical protein